MSVVMLKQSYPSFSQLTRYSGIHRFGLVSAVLSTPWNQYPSEYGKNMVLSVDLPRFRSS